MPARLIRCVVLCSVPCILIGQSARAGDATDALHSMELAIDLYDMGYYEEAGTILERINRDQLDPLGDALWRDHAPRIRKAAGKLAAADRSLDDARMAITGGDYTTARRQLANVMLSVEAPLGTKERAHGHFESIGRAPARHMIDTREPRTTLPINHHRIARSLVNEGLNTLGSGQIHQAQSYFHMAAWHAPQAPRRALVVDPAAGVAFEAKPGSDLEHLAIGEIHNVQVATAVRPVTMNLQLGVGRLLGVNTFRFSDPGGAGSAGGWVQLPNVSRIQVKTTVTAPAQEISLNTGRPITYLVLVRPDP